MGPHRVKSLPALAERVSSSDPWFFALPACLVMDGGPSEGEQSRQLSVCCGLTAAGTQPCFPVKISSPKTS